MSNYHHRTNPPYLIFGGSLDPAPSPSYLPFEEPVQMAHSQSAHSYGSSPRSCQDSYLDSRYMHAAATASASPTFSAPLSFEDNYLYTATYEDQNPVRPTDIDPRDLEYTSVELWMLEPESSLGSSCGGMNTAAPSSYESQSSQDRSTGYVKSSSHVSSRRQSSAREKGGFPCTVEGCTSVGRFSRKTDLTRHISSVHGLKKFDCKFKWCGRHGSDGFSRPDHLREHVREVHKVPIPKTGKGRSKRC